MEAKGSVEHWDNVFSEDGDIFTPLTPVALAAADAHYGDVRGKRLLDIGCGSGEGALHFARRGALVTAIDTSQVAVDRLNRVATREGLENLKAVCASAQESVAMGPFPFIFGSMILHHVEPFDEFARTMREALAPGGKAFFFENSSASRFLIWFRSHLVGKFGIPKHSDEDEYPLSPQEVSLLHNYFTVRVDYPEMLFFQLASHYLLRGKGEAASISLDKLMQKVPPLRRLSYRQCIYLS